MGKLARSLARIFSRSSSSGQKSRRSVADATITKEDDNANENMVVVLANTAGGPLMAADAIIEVQQVPVAQAADDGEEPRKNKRGTLRRRLAHVLSTIFARRIRLGKLFRNRRSFTSKLAPASEEQDTPQREPHRSRASGVLRSEAGVQTTSNDDDDCWHQLGHEGGLGICLEDLPQEVLINIAKRLSIEARVALLQSSEKLKRILVDAVELWKHVDWRLDEYNDASVEVVMTLAEIPHFKTLRLRSSTDDHGWATLTEDFFLDLSECLTLEEVYFDHCHILPLGGNSRVSAAPPFTLAAVTRITFDYCNAVPYPDFEDYDEFLDDEQRDYLEGVNGQPPEVITNQDLLQIAPNLEHVTLIMGDVVTTWDPTDPLLAGL